MGVLFWLPFLVALLTGLLGLPLSIQYICDAAWLSLLVLLLLQRRPMGRDWRTVAIWSGAFFIWTALVYVVRYQSVFYYIWGLRNNFRFFAAFLAFAAFLKKRNVENIFKGLQVLFWINIAVSLYQFFVMELSGDALGGLFGTKEGSNGYTNLFLLIITTHTMMLYLGKQEKVWYTVLKFLAILLIATLAELKFFFVEFILVMVLSILFTSFTWRKLWLIVGGLVAVVLFARILAVMFPKFAGFLAWEFFMETGLSDKGYTFSGDLNRLNAIGQINELWLTNGADRLLGLGLGNCDVSRMSLFHTPFYELYGDMHYSWLSMAFMYLECGWVGLIFYAGFFVLLFIKIRKMEKHCDEAGKIYCRVGKITAIMCLIVMFYNSSLRAESAYMVYFVLAAPFAFCRTQKDEAKL